MYGKSKANLKRFCCEHEKQLNELKQEVHELKDTLLLKDKLSNALISSMPLIENIHMHDVAHLKTKYQVERNLRKNELENYNKTIQGLFTENDLLKRKIQELEYQNRILNPKLSLGDSNKSVNLEKSKPAIPIENKRVSRYERLRKSLSKILTGDEEDIKLVNYAITNEELADNDYLNRAKEISAQIQQLNERTNHMNILNA